MLDLADDAQRVRLEQLAQAAVDTRVSCLEEYLRRSRAGAPLGHTGQGRH